MGTVMHPDFRMSPEPRPATRWAVRVALWTSALLLALAGVAAGALVGVLWRLPLRVEAEVRERLRPHAERLSRDLVLEGLTVDPFHGRVHVAEARLESRDGPRATLSARDITVHFDPWAAALGDRVQAIRAVVVGQVVAVVPATADEMAYDAVRRSIEAELSQRRPATVDAATRQRARPPLTIGEVALRLRRGSEETVIASGKIDGLEHAGQPARLSLAGHVPALDGSLTHARLEVTLGRTVADTVAVFSADAPVVLPVPGLDVAVQSGTVRGDGEAIANQIVLRDRHGRGHAVIGTAAVHAQSPDRAASVSAELEDVAFEGAHATSRATGRIARVTVAAPQGTEGGLSFSAMGVAFAGTHLRVGATGIASRASLVIGPELTAPRVGVEGAIVHVETPAVRATALVGRAEVSESLHVFDVVGAVDMGTVLTCCDSPLPGNSESQHVRTVPMSVPALQALTSRAAALPTLRLTRGALAVHASGESLFLDVPEASSVSANGAATLRLRATLSHADGRRHELALDTVANPAEHVLTARVRLTRLPVSAALAAVLPSLGVPTGAELDVDGNLMLDPVRQLATFAGSATVRDLGLSLRRLVPEPIRGLSFSATEVVAAVSLDGSPTGFAEGTIAVNDARFHLRVLVPRSGESPHLDLTAVADPQPCAGFLATVPDAVLGPIAEAEVSGRGQFSARVVVDFANPPASRLELDGDLTGCILDRLGPEFDGKLQALSDRTYVHHWSDSGVRVGPGTSTWVPLSDLPPYVGGAALVTEDARFYDHGGFSVTALERSLREAVSLRRFHQGGSTISMQLAKNLFLDRKKVLARKLREAVLTWAIERRLGKDYLLELYLNIIEYGPGIYGIENAARFYFDKSAVGLDPLETAFLMALKPQPRWGYRQWQKNEVTAKWRAYLELILSRLEEKGFIPALTAETFAPYQPAFRRPAPGERAPKTKR